MPYKWQTNKVLLPKEKDKRRKLTDEDKADILRLYKKEKLLIREIARMFENKCTRRTIQFVIFPERLKTVNFKGHWKKYYKKEYNTKAIREHRRYKTKALKDN